MQFNKKKGSYAFKVALPLKPHLKVVMIGHNLPTPLFRCTRQFSPIEVDRGGSTEDLVVGLTETANLKRL